jgi:hypothetical protein
MEILLGDSMNDIKAFLGTNQHFSLYVEGIYDNISDDNIMALNPEYIFFAYYTYPNLRRVYVARLAQENEQITLLPNIEGKLFIISKFDASKLNKFKKAVSFMRTKMDIVRIYQSSIKFFARLEILLNMKGSLDYLQLYRIIQDEIK